MLATQHMFQTSHLPSCIFQRIMAFRMLNKKSHVPQAQNRYGFVLFKNLLHKSSAPRMHVWQLLVDPQHAAFLPLAVSCPLPSQCICPRLGVWSTVKASRSEAHDAGRNPSVDRYCLDWASLVCGLRIDCERDMHTVDLKLSWPAGLVNSRCPPSGKDGTDLVAPCRLGPHNTRCFCEIQELVNLRPVLL